ncbi:RND transporter [Betaproteobacteria bacterium]|nr:RND transporter [Betaproteobacteria bacterium]
MHKLKTPVLVFAITALLSGCAIGPDFARPDTALPEQYGAEGNIPVAAEAKINAEWWTLFGDATLDQLVEQALANNQDLQAAVARMEAAAAAAREAGADYFPGVDLAAGASRTRTSGRLDTGSPAMRLNDRYAQLGINYELDLWGRVRRSNEAARAEALAGRFSHDTVRQSLIAQVVATYLNLRVQDVEVLATTRNLQSQTKTRDIILGRRDVGAASDLEYAQARAAQAATSAQLSESLRQRALTENLLALLVGQPGNRLEPLADNAVPLPPLPPVGLPSDLLAARPDLRQAEETLVAANARIGVARSAYFPSIGLTGFLGSESARLADLFSAPAAIWSFGAGLAMPIFDAGRTGARVDQATARQRETLANYRKTVQNAFREVRDALISLQMYDREEADLLIQLTAAGDALKLSNARYDVGYSGFLEVLDSQRTYNSAQLQYLAARRNRLLATVDLFKALGGGWQEDDAKTPQDDAATSSAKAD